MDQELSIKRMRWNKALQIYNNLGQLVQQLLHGLKSSIWLKAEIWSLSELMWNCQTAAE